MEKKDSKEKAKSLKREVILPAGVTFMIRNEAVVVKGKMGEAEKLLRSKRVSIRSEEGKVLLETSGISKNDKKMIGTFAAHIRNLVRGVTSGYTYTLKVCSEHFPMTVSASNNELIVKNFLGERYPRKLKLRKDVKVEITGNEIVVTSNNRESAGQCAASIETLAKRPNFDRRIFQDGIFITSKPGKEI